jgi:hypothetical protein
MDTFIIGGGEGWTLWTCGVRNMSKVTHSSSMLFDVTFKTFVQLCGNWSMGVRLCESVCNIFLEILV